MYIEGSGWDLDEGDIWKLGLALCDPHLYGISAISPHKCICSHFLRFFKLLRLWVSYKFSHLM
jgi:hypothetical protein